MKQSLILLSIAALLSCGGKATTGKQYAKDSVAQTKADLCLTEDSPKETSKSLNDIRFQGWEENDWFDNDYIRTLRKYIDDFNEGNVKDENLVPYKKFTKCKFAIFNVEPFITGGLYIQISFLDLPDRVFTSWVYSTVDEENEQVVNYELRSIKIEDEQTDFTKDEILRLAKEHPECKVIW